MKDKTGAPIIARDASISLVTAVPGSFKTARVVDWMLGATEAGELVFASNFEDLKVPGVMPFEDPRDWIKDGVPQLPPGSILVVDEAQKFFRTRASGAPPAYITEMETIRHHGIRLVLVTQQPNYLDIHIRGLVGRHEHLVRKSGRSYATVYAKNGCMDEVRDHKRVARNADDKFRYSPRPLVRKMYKSATVHTVEHVMESKYRTALKVLPLCLLASAGVWWSVFAGAEEKAHKAPSARAPLAAPVSAVPEASKSDAQDAPTSAEELAASLVPRIPGALWSAPAYDDRPIVSEPRSVCMSSVDSCTCMSEQGTIVVEEIDLCRFKAAKGEAYNPKKAPKVEQNAPAMISPPESAEEVPVLSGVVASGRPWLGDVQQPIAAPPGHGEQAAGGR